MKHTQENSPSNSQQTTSWMPIGMCLGFSIGTAIGFLTDNISIGMCLGISIGMSVGVLIDHTHGKSSQTTDPTTDSVQTDVNNTTDNANPTE